METFVCEAAKRVPTCGAGAVAVWQDKLRVPKGFPLGGSCRRMATDEGKASGLYTPPLW